MCVHNYTEKELVRIAKRENNSKRSFLVVNPLQGKHVPVSPGAASALFGQLAKIVGDAYPGERLLLVGFAETATAIGASVATKLSSCYIQTTRETPGDVGYLYFTESHSHATEQKLVREDMDAVIRGIDRIVFVEDEVTTGNTILGIVDVLKKRYPGSIPFSVASLLNGMDDAALLRYRKRGIGLHYLVKTDHAGYAELAAGIPEDGQYSAKNVREPDMPVHSSLLTGCLDARRCVDGAEYLAACQLLWEQVSLRNAFDGAGSVLVIGTEEFMFPALYVAAKIEEGGRCVRFHATTRSPIAVSRREGYPLSARYELESLYEEGRRTFLYNLKKYDCVLILTDAAEPNPAGIHSLVNAVSSCGNQKIFLYVWRGQGQLRHGGEYEKFL